MPAVDQSPPTKEELQKIAKCMENPEFRTLMADYLKSFNDPETRKEEEEYMKQLERESAEGNYKLQVLLPKPEFCVRCRNAAREKVFINICSSEKIEPFSEQATGNSRASQWSVPISIGKDRKELDGHGHEVETWDAVFHPKTVKLANDSNRFMCFLVEIAVEHINEGYKRSIVPEFKRLGKCQSKGRPAAQTVRMRSDGPDDPAVSIPGVDPSVMQTINLMPTRPPAAKQATATASSSSASAKPAVAPKEGPKPASKRQPKYQIVYRGETGLQDAWNEREKADRHLPSHLLVRIDLPELTSSSQVDVEITNTNLELASEKFGYALNLTLPFQVDSDKAGATFDKTKHRLTITLPVIPHVNPKIEEINEERAKRKAELEAEARRQIEEEERTKAEAERKNREEEETRKKLAEEEARRKQAEAEQRRKEMELAEEERKRQLAATAVAERERKLMEIMERAKAAAAAAAATSAAPPKEQTKPSQATTQPKADSPPPASHPKDENKKEPSSQAEASAQSNQNAQMEALQNRLAAERLAEQHEASKLREEALLPLKNPFIFGID